MHLVEDFLTEVRRIYTLDMAGPELPYYPAVSSLLNAVGARLSPKIRCVLHPRDIGAGNPDGALYAHDAQLSLANGVGSLRLSSCTAIEVKPPSMPIEVLASSEQVNRYAAAYGQVLVTNLRSFALVACQEGQTRTLETFTLAGSESVFWMQPIRLLVKGHGDDLIEFLTRCLLSQSALSSPKEIAGLLASYAREALRRIEAVQLPALFDTRAALEQSLGLHFQGVHGDHFFRSTLVQTLFYGIFSGWVLWGKRTPGVSTQRFDWKTAGWELQVPVIRALFHQLIDPRMLKPLDLDEVLDRAADVLNRVDQATFFTRFADAEAIQHFYEPFLDAFDPELRKQLGVWYTPSEVVQYMVTRIDTVLRDELQISAGLADENVLVLDPATGTGSFLVEVIRCIHRKLSADGDGKLAALTVKEAVTQRLFGFEILPAPFVVAHLQIGVLLHELGVPLSDELNERAQVMLTNALTIGQTPDEPRQLSFTFFKELEDERSAANAVKRSAPIMVVLGNPPYNGYPGMAIDEERDLTDAYRVAVRTRQPQGRGLNDLYVRFFRLAERKIVEGAGRGVVCYVSNSSWLDGLSYSAMRERYLDAFDAIWIDNLNGDKRKTGKLTPTGDPDPSIFSTEWNREGIQVGTAIALLVRSGDDRDQQQVRYRDLWGKTKQADLLASAIQDGRSLYQELTPSVALGLPLTPGQADEAYLAWPLLPDLFPASSPGVKTSRDEFVTDIDRERLVDRMTAYFDPTVDHAQMQAIAPRAMQDAAGFTAIATREYLIKRGFLPSNVIPFEYRPFDTRWLYWEPETSLIDRKRERYYQRVSPENRWIGAVQQNRKAYDPPLVTSRLCSLHVIERGANLFPLSLAGRHELTFPDPHGAINQTNYNLSEAAIEYLDQVGAVAEVEHLFDHVVAILHAPRYVIDNIAALSQDWPRIPLPSDASRLRSSAARGEHVRHLLDSHEPVDGVTHGSLHQELHLLGLLSTTDDREVGPHGLRVTAGWGRLADSGAVTPGTGHVLARDFTAEERATLVAGLRVRGLDTSLVDELFGSCTYDVFINDRVFWKNVPAHVWLYRLGGYQVIKKWLSYRESDILGRDLNHRELIHVRDMIRRIAALLLVGPALDANYDVVRQSAYDWQPSRSTDRVGSEERPALNH